MKGWSNERTRTNGSGAVSKPARVNLNYCRHGQAIAIQRKNYVPAGGGASHSHAGYWCRRGIFAAVGLPRHGSKGATRDWYFGGRVWRAVYRTAVQSFYQLQKTLTRFIFRNFLGLSVGLGFIFAGL